MSYRIVKNEQGQRVARLRASVDVSPECLDRIARLANEAGVSIDDFVISMLQVVIAASTETAGSKTT